MYLSFDSLILLSVSSSQNYIDDLIIFELEFLSSCLALCNITKTKKPNQTDVYNQIITMFDLYLLPLMNHSSNYLKIIEHNQTENRRYFRFKPKQNGIS